MGNIYICHEISGHISPYIFVVLEIDMRAILFKWTRHVPTTLVKKNSAVVHLCSKKNHFCPHSPLQLILTRARFSAAI